jgi:serine/threonine-protein kinase
MGISPDGSRIAYVSEGQLYVRALDQFEGAAIAGTQGAGSPFFAPDGRWIGFHADGKLQRVSLSGGAPLTITNAALVFGASWGPDDTIVFGGGVGSGLLRVPASGGTAEPLTSPDQAKGEVSHGLPHVLPDGRGIVFTVGTGEGSRVALLSLESGASRELLSAGAGAQYLSSGHLLFTETGNLRLVAFDADRSEVSGPIIPAMDQILWENHAGLENAWFAVSRGGDLVYVSGDLQELSTQPVWVDRTGRETPIEVPPALYLGPRIAPDGRYIAFSRVGKDGVGELWILEPEGGRMFPVTAQGANYNPTWRWDAQERLTFTSNGDLFETLVGQQAPPVRLLPRDNYQYPLSWSPDGRFLAFMEIAPAGTSLWMMPRDGEPTPLLESRANAGAARFSPDGEWLAYVSDETGQQEVYVRRYPSGERGQQVSRNGGAQPVWSADGRTLFYRMGGRMMAVDITTKPAFRSGTPTQLWDKPLFQQALFGVHNYDVAADGRFLMLRVPDQPTTTRVRINVVLNWLAELQERVTR